MGHIESLFWKYLKISKDLISTTIFGSTNIFQNIHSPCIVDFIFLLVNWKDLTLEERRTVSVIFQDLEKYLGMSRGRERRIYWYHVAKIANHQKGCLGTYWQKKSPVIVKQFFRLSAQSYVCNKIDVRMRFCFMHSADGQQAYLSWLLLDEDED